MGFSEQLSRDLDMQFNNFLFRMHGGNPMYLAAEYGDKVIGGVMTSKNPLELYVAKSWDKKYLSSISEKSYFEIGRTEYWQFKLSQLQYTIMRKLFSGENVYEI